jgi:hypothetical protein
MTEYGAELLRRQLAGKQYYENTIVDGIVSMDFLSGLIGMCFQTYYFLLSKNLCA